MKTDLLNSPTDGNTAGAVNKARSNAQQEYYYAQGKGMTGNGSPYNAPLNRQHKSGCGCNAPAARAGMKQQVTQPAINSKNRQTDRAGNFNLPPDMNKK